MRMTPETFRFHVGNFSCLAMQDATNQYPIGMFISNLPHEQYEPWLRGRGQSLDEFEASYICLLIDTGRERVLVDTGCGTGGFLPIQGKLLEQLRAENIERDEIGTVILTHAHPDHVGATLNEEDGKPTFRNARYVMFAQEWEYWVSNPSVAELPVEEAFRQGLVTSAQKNLFGIREQLELLSKETEIV